MGDRRKNKGKPSRAGRADTGDFSSYIGAQSTSVPPNPRRFHVDTQEFIEDHHIREKIDTAIINRDSRSDRFVTLDSLQKIWDRSLLTQFLAVLGYEDDAALFDNIRKYLLKTLSILLVIRWDNWTKFGEIFLEYRDGGMVRHDRKDDRLPYSLSELEDESFLGTSWASSFLNTQYTFIPIFLIERGKDDEIDKDEIYPRTRPLPFIRSKKRLIAQGGYGTVTREVIACHQFRSKTNYKWGSIPNPVELAVARKRFEARGDFKKEARNLASLNSSLSDHSRIVKYIAVFTIEDEDDIYAAKEFNILLPLADADLQKFLYNERFEARFGNVVELLQEASNVADAIQWLHAGRSINGSILVCCHMDIKLDNILVYLNCPSPVGWWKISDFGISSMIEREDEQTVPRRPPSTLLTVPPADSLAIIKGTIKTSAKRAAGAYSAPEVEEGNQVGRPSDIWSFGCILFQVLARAAGGIQLLQELDEKRASFENGSKNDHFCQRSVRGKSLHPSVRQWLESRDSLPHGSFLDRLVVMNCKDMILSALSIESKVRPTAEQLRDKLVEVAKGGGRKYLFDHDSKMVSAAPTAEPSRSKPNRGATPQNKVTPSVPSSPQRTHLTSTEVQYPSMNKRPSPPFSTQPISQLPVANQTPLLTLQPPLTPPLDNEDQSAMPGLQLNLGGPGTAIFNQAPTRKPLASPPDRPEREPDPFPTWKPRASTQDRAERESHPSTSHQAEHSLTSAITSSHLPLRPPVTPFLGEKNQVSFPKKRSRHDSGQTSFSSVYDVQVRRSESTGEVMPFQAPLNVISTLISSTRAKIAFVTPGSTEVYTLYSPYSKKTIRPPTNYAWQKGCLAGNYLALLSASDTHSAQGLHLYKLFVGEREELDYQEIRSERKFPYFEKFAVSRDGRLLLGSSNTVWLHPSFQVKGEELRVRPPGRTRSAKDGMLQSGNDGKLQRVWFSTNGLLAFAWISLSGNVHHVRIWDVADTTKTGGLNHEISASDMTASAVKSMVHFPSSPMCIVWKQHDIISLLQNSTSPNIQQVLNSPQLKNLQAIAVTPNEEAVVFIKSCKTFTWKGLQLTSKISVARIKKMGDHRIFGDISADEDLQYHLDKPDKCDVVIEERTGTNTKVRVLIAHHNGNFEVKEINLPI